MGIFYPTQKKNTITDTNKMIASYEMMVSQCLACLGLFPTEYAPTLSTLTKGYITLLKKFSKGAPVRSDAEGPIVMGWPSMLNIKNLCTFAAHSMDDVANQSINFHRVAQRTTWTWASTEKESKTPDSWERLKATWESCIKAEHAIQETLMAHMAHKSRSITLK